MADKPAPSDSYVRRFALVTPRTKLFCQLLAALELVQVKRGDRRRARQARLPQSAGRGILAHVDCLDASVMMPTAGPYPPLPHRSRLRKKNQGTTRCGVPSVGRSDTP